MKKNIFTNIEDIYDKLMLLGLVIINIEKDEIIFACNQAKKIFKPSKLQKYQNLNKILNKKNNIIDEKEYSLVKVDNKKIIIKKIHLHEKNLSNTLVLIAKEISSNKIKIEIEEQVKFIKPIMNFINNIWVFNLKSREFLYECKYNNFFPCSSTTSNEIIEYRQLKKHIHKHDNIIEINDFFINKNRESKKSIKYEIVEKNNTHKIQSFAILKSSENKEFLIGFNIEIFDIDEYQKPIPQIGNHRLDLDAITDGWWRWSMGTNEMYISSKFKNILGYSDEQMPNSFRAWKNLIDKEDYIKAKSALKEYLKKDKPFIISLKYRGKDDNIFWMVCKGKRLENSQGKTRDLIGTHTDITKLKRSEMRLSSMVNYDSLTKLPSRSYFMRKLHEVTKNNNKLAICFIDLDNFKKINDTKGHSEGDAVIQEVALRMLAITEEKDFIARLGGDEFALIINYKKKSNLFDILSHYTSIFDDIFVIGENRYNVTCSIGVAICPESGQTPLTLLKKADLAMYQAKDLGKNRYHIYNSEKEHRQSKEYQIEQLLQKINFDEELSLVYQPQISLSDMQVVGIEVLLRWNHKDLGEISPSLFIKVAEENKMIIEIGKWVLNRAILDFLIIKRKFDNNIKLSINISVIQLMDAEFHVHLNDILKTYDVPPSSLIFEITETAIIKKTEEIFRIVRNLHAYGVNFALDDFGAGYFSLQILRDFPISIIKIDRSFISNIHKITKDTSMILGLLLLVNKIGITAIAEGVELSAQEEILKNKGCHIAQGFYYAKPLEFMQLISFLEKSTSTIE